MKDERNQVRADVRNWAANTQSADESISRALKNDNNLRINKLLYDAGVAWFKNGKTLEEVLSKPEILRDFANNLEQFNSLGDVKITVDYLHAFEEGYEYAKLYDEGYNIGITGKIINNFNDIDYRVEKGYKDGMIEYGRKMYDITPNLEQIPLEYRKIPSFRRGFLEKMGYNFAISGVSIIELQTKLKKSDRENSNFIKGYKEGLKEYQIMQNSAHSHGSR